MSMYGACWRRVRNATTFFNRRLRTRPELGQTPPHVHVVHTGRRRAGPEGGPLRRFVTLAWPAPLTAILPLAAYPPTVVLDGAFWVLWFPWILIATVRALAANDRAAIRYPAALLVAAFPVWALLSLAVAAL